GLVFFGVGAECVDFRPERGEVDAKSFAAGDVGDDALGHAEGMRVAAVGAELEDLEGAELGIDEPVPLHAERGVLSELLDAIASLVARRRRHHLDRDARRDADESPKRWASRVTQVDGEVGHAPAPWRDPELRAGSRDEDAALASPVADYANQERDH